MTLLQRMALTLFLALLTTGSCSFDESEATDTIELTAWVTYQGTEKEKFNELVERFCQKYEKEKGQKIKIIAKQVPFDDLVTNIKMACQSGRTPDIARVDVQKILELAYHKVLVKIDELPNFKAKSIDHLAREYMKVPYYTNVVETKNRQGDFERHLYGLPEQTSCLALFWNRRLFREFSQDLEKAGLDPRRAPRTWEEVIAYGKVLTRKEGGDQYYGFAMRNSLWWTLPFFGLHKARFISSDDRGFKSCNLGDERTTAALQLKVDLYRKHGVEAGAWKSGSLGPNVGFTNEKFAMIFTGPWRVKEFRQKGLDFGVSLIPRIGKKRARKLGISRAPKSATNVGGNNMVIFRSCRHKEAAYEFIRFLTRWESQLEWCRELGQIPINRKAARILSGKEPHPSGEKIEVDPVITTFMEQIEYAQLPPQLPRMGYIESDVVNPEMELALKGQKTPRQALKSAAEKIEEKVLRLVNE